MALREFPQFPLFDIAYATGMSADPAATTLSASTHWVGGQFWATSTENIETIYFRTGSVTSPVFQLEAAVTALDANGYPLGADVAVSSTTATNPTANTWYGLTISAAVTKGTLYGIIIRVKSGTYTSGSANIAFRMAPPYPLLSGNLGIPCCSANTGSNSKLSAWPALIPKYASGYLQSPTRRPVGTSGTVTIAATSGNATGNKFTIRHRMRVSGYMMYADYDNPANVEMYTGSDNTAMTGSAVTLTSGYRHQTTSGNSVLALETPIILDPGTYRIALRNTSAASNQIQQITAIHDAGMLDLLSVWASGIMKSTYASSAWTDDTTGVTSITPIIDAVDDGLPWPSYQLGV